MDRRDAVRWMLTAAASVVFLEQYAAGGPAPAAVAPAGYGTDPDLVRDFKPGDLWPLTLTAAQHRTVAALCDVIIPADGKSPSASALKVPDFIDEWISAPYPAQIADRKVILDGLGWLEAESQRRFGANFPELAVVQQLKICDDICHLPDAKPEYKPAARFFNKFRDLTAGGFYTTPEGMKDIGYVGNVPLPAFEGPPPAVLKQLGLA